MRENKTIIIRIRGKLAILMKEVLPELKEYDHKGTLFFYLTKFMYGLAEAARAFYDRVHGILVSLGFKRSEVDEGLFVKKVDGTQQVHTVCLHVDDILSLAPNTDARKALEQGLKQHFGIKEQHGSDISYLGLVIKRTKTGDISVSQIGYTQDILKRYKDDIDNKTSKIPASTELIKHEENPLPLKNKSKYLSAVMSLMYLAKLTRPDILMPVSFLATRSQNPSVKSHQDLRQVMRYVNATRTAGLLFETSAAMTMTLYADASHLTHSDGRGHTGIAIKFGNTVVATRSTKQKIQARSSTEAELIAAEECATYVPYLRKLCQELGVPQRGPLVMGQDNKSSMFIMVQGGQFQRVKHMLSRIAYLRSMVDSKEIQPSYVPTKDMVADILTKPLPAKLLQHHKLLLGMMDC